MQYLEYPKFERGQLMSEYDKLPFGEKKIITDFVNYVSISAKSKTRLENNKRSLIHFRIIVSVDFDGINLEDLRRYLALLNFSYHTNSSRNDLKASIKRFLRWRFKKWSSRFDELRDLKLVTSKNESKINASTIIKKEDVEIIVKTEPSLNWKAFFLTLYETGFRPIEIRTLKWSNITFDVRQNVSRINIISTKTSHARSAFVQGATHFLREHKRRQRNSPNGFVFPAPRNPFKPIGKGGVSEWLKAITLKAIGRSVTPYVVRHSRATELYLNPGIPDKIAQKILGHSANMSDTYTHMSDDDVLNVCCDTIYQFEDVAPEKKEAYEQRIKQLEYNVGIFKQELAEIKEMNSRILQMAEMGIVSVTAMPSQTIKPVVSF